MCNRYVSPDEAAIERFWNIGHRNQWPVQLVIFPRALGPFIRPRKDAPLPELVVGQWGLIPAWAKSAKLTYSTNNARFEELTQKASYKLPWARRQRCIIPAWSFDEPCWESGRNVWWRFRRTDGAPWGLAGLWNAWTDPSTREVIESYTMLTINADEHPLMSRMHRPAPRLPPDQQHKRSIVAIELADVETWLSGSTADAARLMHAPPMSLIDAAPM